MCMNAVAVEGNRGCEDDEEHDQVREKRSHADIHSPLPKSFDRCSSPLRKGALPCRLFLLQVHLELCTFGQTEPRAFRYRYGKPQSKTFLIGGETIAGMPRILLAEDAVRHPFPG